jgi:hypothetical protein
MSTMSKSSTNCLTCNISFISGTAICMYNVGDFCSPACFTTHIGKGKKHVTFGPDSVHEYESESTTETSGFVRPSSQAPLMHKTPPPVAVRPHRPSSRPPSGTVHERAAVIESLLNGRSPVVSAPTVPVAPAMPAPIVHGPVMPAPIVNAPAVHDSIYYPNSYYSQIPNNVIVQNFPKDLLPPPLLKISATPPKPQPQPQPQYINHVGFCTFCKKDHVITCENANGQKFCDMGLLVRYGNGYAHAMANTNPTYIQGLGTFDSWARYAVPFVHIK